MSTRVSYFIACDICGESDGYSHTEDIARAEVRSHGWIRQRNERGELVDMCWRCVEFSERHATNKNEVQAWLATDDDDELMEF